MKKYIYLLFVLLCAAPVSAQIERAAKSVFTLTTFKADGTVLATTRGVFISGDSIGVSSWTPFVGANRATVIDASGKEATVRAVTGANEIYDLCRFRLDRHTPSAREARQPLKAADRCWIILYSVSKPDIEQRNVQGTESFGNELTYYKFSSNMPDNVTGCPVVNSDGEVIGLMQQSASDGSFYSTDIHLADSLRVGSALAISDALLRQTQIPTDYPAGREQALVMMTLAKNVADSALYNRYVDNFISLYPTAVDGYANKATSQMEGGHYAEADATMATALSKVPNKDEVHGAYARLIYQKAVSRPDSVCSSWTLDKALEESRKAYAIKHSEGYRHQEGQILYAKGNYQQAYDIFMALTKTPLRSGELYLEAAQSKAGLKATPAEILTLLDSAVAICPQPLNAQAAPYVLARANVLYENRDFRKAVSDYNLYDSLMLGRPINSQFYYVRAQAELQIRQYQQAMNDIDRAIYLTPTSAQLWAEKAQLHYRFSQLSEAIQSAEQALKIDPKLTDAWLLLGLAEVANKNKVEGVKAFQQAKVLGDQRADEYISKYK